jgi:hypothetical protein
MRTAASGTLAKGFAVSTALYSKAKQSDDRDMIILLERERERAPVQLRECRRLLSSKLAVYAERVAVNTSTVSGTNTIC